MVKKEILSALFEFDILNKVLSTQHYQALYQAVLDKFALGVDKFPLWENLNDSESLKEKDGWLLISDFVGNEEVVLFLDNRTEKFAITLNGSKDLNKLLSNTFHFVFYITNINVDYLLCFNEHDFIIASGKAKLWLRGLEQ
jgi:hypothetical protein